MKKLLAMALCVLTAVTVMAAVEINETNFPDANFRNWVLAQSYGQDGVLTDAEIAKVKDINVYGKSIQSLKGIEFFTALTELDCSRNQLTSLDVSKNTALTDLYCYWNPLTSLDVSGCTALKYLYCYSNQLTTLDVSKNTALAELFCSSNQLTSLDVSKNTALAAMNCGENQLTSLDVSKNTALRHLYCGNNQLTSLDVSKNTALTWLDCYSNQIKGAGMDALVQSLPTSGGSLYVIYNENEGNVMTTTQVAAAKAKNWKVYYYDGSEWKEYAGSEPAGIEAVAAGRKADSKSGRWYDMQGRQLTGQPAVSGVYIRDGRKVVVR